MKIISHSQIAGLNISPVTCVNWVRESFHIKAQAQLPAKISVHPSGNDYYTAMPCLLPSSFDRVGLKMIHRVKGCVPSIGSDMLLYEASTGTLLSIMDGDWITTMRTGATAYVAIQALRKDEDVKYCFIGLGNTARATMLCILESEPDIMHNVLLKAYKNQAEDFIARFSSYNNVSFEISDDIYDIISSSDVIVSSITDANGLICDDLNCFREGCLLVPIHVRGFSNCDTVFDKVFGDDTAPLRSWRYFNEFRHYGELSDVLEGKDGRSDGKERILSYNYGLGLHDALFASRIFEIVRNTGTEVKIQRPTEKFWL